MLILLYIYWYFVAFLTCGIMVLVKDLHHGPLLVAKGKQVSGKRIPVQLIFYKYRQAVNRLPHIGYADGQVDFHIAMNKKSTICLQDGNYSGKRSGNEIIRNR